MACAVAALLGAMLSWPVVASESGRITFVQGRPGVRVDICVGTAEVVSGLAYGRHASRAVGMGARHVRFLKASPGRCAGTKLVGWYRMVTPGSDTTVVFTKDTPRIVVFPDNLQYQPDPGSSRILMRHAADLGAAGFRYTFEAGETWHPSPTAEDPFEKGQWGGGNWLADLRPLWWVNLPPDQAAIAGPVELVTEADTRHEFILVGTTPFNARLLRIDTPY